MTCGAFRSERGTKGLTPCLNAKKISHAVHSGAIDKTLVDHQNQYTIHKRILFPGYPPYTPETCPEPPPGTFT